jgi:hypothetical protein
MALLSDLPTEIIHQILSHLKHHQFSWEKKSITTTDGAPFLPFAQTNKRLWNIAKPFLYQELLICGQLDNIDAIGSPHFFYPSPQTSLLWRTLQETPILASLQECQGWACMIKFLNTGGPGS